MASPSGAGSASTLPNVSADVMHGNGVKGENEKDAAPKPLVSVNLEALMHDVKRRGLQKGRNAEEVEAMAQTAARYVRCILIVSLLNAHYS